MKPKKKENALYKCILLIIANRTFAMFIYDDLVSSGIESLIQRGE